MKYSMGSVYRTIGLFHAALWAAAMAFVIQTGIPVAVPAVILVVLTAVALDLAIKWAGLWDYQYFTWGGMLRSFAEFIFYAGAFGFAFLFADSAGLQAVKSYWSWWITLLGLAVTAQALYTLDIAVEGGAWRVIPDAGAWRVVPLVWHAHGFAIYPVQVLAAANLLGVSSRLAGAAVRSDYLYTVPGWVQELVRQLAKSGNGAAELMVSAVPLAIFVMAALLILDTAVVNRFRAPHQMWCWIEEGTD